jgi:hypothetical protein
MPGTSPDRRGDELPAELDLQGYNARAAVAGHAQVIVAQTATPIADVDRLIPLVTATTKISTGGRTRGWRTRGTAGTTICRRWRAGRSTATSRRGG